MITSLLSDPNIKAKINSLVWIGTDRCDELSAIDKD